MKFIIKCPPRNNVYNLHRQIGYIYQRKEGNKASLIRPLEHSGFPRFHIYLEPSGLDLIINLHLDQKKAIYEGVSAHSSEYNDKAVELEAQRIQNILK